MRWVAVPLVGLLLAGCATPSPVVLPAGVTVTAYQGRFDRAERQLELKVANGSDAVLTVTGASFDSTRFMAPAQWDRSQDIPVGSARDLRVQLGEPQCDPSIERDEVVLHFTLADGTTGTARLSIDDTSAIDAIHAEDCLIEATAAVATLVPGARLEWTPGAHLPASLEIIVSPTGAPGSIRISETRATVLLSLVDDSGAVVFSQPEDVLVDAGTPPAVIMLRLVPARCDPHAVAEDKRGTIFPLHVLTSDGQTGDVVVAVGDAVRGELYAFYGDYCGLP